MSKFKLFIAVLLSAALSGYFIWSYARQWSPAREDFAEQGVDVSEANGAIDWPVSKADDINFVYVRATHGSTHRDAQFDTNWHALAEAGINHGALHSFSLCDLAVAQAGNFTATVPRDPNALPVAVDLDFRSDCPALPARDVVLDEVRTLAAILETHSGKPVILRISPEFEDRYQISGAIARPLWATGNFLRPDYLARPWTLWTASNIRRIEGADQPVNWNVIAP